MKKYLNIPGPDFGVDPLSPHLILANNILWIDTVSPGLSVDIYYKQMNKAGTGPIKLQLVLLPIGGITPISTAKKILKKEIRELLSSDQMVMESSMIISGVTYNL